MNLGANFTPRCGRAIEAAKRFSAGAGLDVRTDHLIMGLLSLDGGVAVNLMKSAGVTQPRVQEYLSKVESSVSGGIASALKSAEEEARLLEHTYVGTEHLLNALLCEKEGPAAKLFDHFMVNRRAVIFAVLKELGMFRSWELHTALILEDNAERELAFQKAAKDLALSAKIWPRAEQMISQCDDQFESMTLMSLDHDMAPDDPGSGRDVSEFLAGHLPMAPVIVHSTNTDAAWSMHNDLRFAGWTVERVGPMGTDWVEKLWLPKARELMAKCRPHALFRKHGDHELRVEAALDSLEALAIGDALGEMLSYGHRNAEKILAGSMPPGPWMRTDDSEMALSIFEILRLYGYAHQDAIARKFAWRFERDPQRGYGSGTRMQLAEVNRGGDWRKLAAGAFGGRGSLGNGAAMRTAPLGAFFWRSQDRVMEEAERSAVVTHTHAEGIAGGIAVALAAMEARRLRMNDVNEKEVCAAKILEAALETPKSDVRKGIEKARALGAETTVEEAVKVLGNGSGVTAADTAPFAIWCAAHYLGNFVKAIGKSISAGGDCDTNTAIVGGIVGAYCGREGMPPGWKNARERFPWELG